MLLGWQKLNIYQCSPVPNIAQRFRILNGAKHRWRSFWSLIIGPYWMMWRCPLSSQLGPFRFCSSIASSPYLLFKNLWKDWGPSVQTLWVHHTDPYLARFCVSLDLLNPDFFPILRKCFLFSYTALEVTPALPFASRSYRHTSAVSVDFNKSLEEL